MKYGKSAFPYLALLSILLIVMPLTSRQFQKSQEVVVEVKIKKNTTTPNQLAKVRKNQKNKKNLNPVTSK